MRELKRFALMQAHSHVISTGSKTCAFCCCFVYTKWSVPLMGFSYMTDTLWKWLSGSSSICVIFTCTSFSKVLVLVFKLLCASLCGWFCQSSGAERCNESNARRSRLSYTTAFLEAKLSQLFLNSCSSKCSASSSHCIEVMVLLLFLLLFFFFLL